jgi:hypothetical protein
MNWSQLFAICGHVADDGPELPGHQEGGRFSAGVDGAEGGI